MPPAAVAARRRRPASMMPRSSGSANNCNSPSVSLAAPAAASGCSAAVPVPAAQSTSRSKKWSAISKRCSAGGRGPPTQAASRSQIVAALQANGCRDEAVAERRLPGGLGGARNLLDQLFGGGIRQRGSIDELGDPDLRGEDDRHVRRIPEALEGGGWVNDEGRIRYSAPPGIYRTLCVRTCDGYYFPMSSASSPSDFERDQANCRSSCPGTEVQIYYHRRGQESDAMVSGLSAQPYAELPTAYLYKQTGTPSPAGCACSARRNDATKELQHRGRQSAGRGARASRAGRTLSQFAARPRRRPGNAGKSRRRAGCGDAKAHGGDAEGQQVEADRRGQEDQGRRACIPA